MTREGKGGEKQCATTTTTPHVIGETKDPVGNTTPHGRTDLGEERPTSSSHPSFLRPPKPKTRRVETERTPV